MLWGPGLAHLCLGKVSSLFARPSFESSNSACPCQSPGLTPPSWVPPSLCVLPASLPMPRSLIIFSAFQMGMLP